MSSLPTLPPEVRRILDLARRARGAARDALAKLPLQDQVALVCETPASQRGRLLELVPEPEKLVPALPEAELCYTAKAIGLHDAGWMLGHATAQQLVACVDLDVWRGVVPDRGEIDAWLRALGEAGVESLLAGVRALDAELVVLALRARIDVTLKTSEPDWEAPGGARTIDGQFYFRALSEGDDLADVESLLSALFEHDYWHYFRLIQAVVWEPAAENEEWALRWRTGRLLDMGFPSWEEAMAIYGRIPVEALAALPPEQAPVEIGGWSLPIWMPPLAAAATAAGPSLFRALSALPEAERTPHLYAFVALANAVAVADNLPLGDAETMPACFQRAARIAGRGLDFVAAQRGLDPTQVLRRVSLQRLFRVGATLEDESPPKP